MVVVVRARLRVFRGQRCFDNDDWERVEYAAERCYKTYHYEYVADAGEPRVGRHRAVHACALRFLLIHPKRIFETLEGQIAANFRTKTFLLFVLTNIAGLFDGKVFQGCLN